MRVADFMSRSVATIDASEHLDVAADIMRLGRLRHLPVMSRGRLVGILSQRDLLHASSSSVLPLGHEAAREWMAQVAVTDVMHTEVITTEPHEQMRVVAEVLLLKRIGCLPVLDQGNLVGLITETDCLRLLTAILARRDDLATRNRGGGI